MIVELTPQIVTSSLVLIILSAPTLTLLLSAVLLWRYRRAIIRAMDATARGHVALATSDPVRPSRDGRSRPGEANADRLYRLAVGGPWENALRQGVAGLAFALVFAVAARFVYPIRNDWVGFLVGVWIYLWPVVLALPLIVRGRVRLWVGWTAGYVVVYTLLGVVAASIPDIPAFTFGGVEIPARSGVTPRGMLILWLSVNAAPTFLVLVCFNRRVRAVAPLVLALVTTAISGTWVVLLTMFSSRGADATVSVAVATAVSVYWLVLGTVVLALAIFGAAGWALARWIGRAYRRRGVSDQSLLLDGLWLLFASFYTMWLALGGLRWTATAPAAFLAYKLVLAAGRRLRPATAQVGPGLTFLRVFSLGRRSDVLFEAMTRSWRHVGRVQLITGPDVALTTVQPHQFLDYLSGRLARHFVRDEVTLEERLAERERGPDPDGRFRISNFFCHADTWEAALRRLVDEGDAVLMDLRSFSRTNRGCTHELQHLVQHVSVDRWVLIVDTTTDRPLLERTVQDAWTELPDASPNARRSPAEMTVIPFEPDPAAWRGLLRRLCAVGLAPAS